MDSSVSDQNLITRWFSKNSVRLLTLASVIVAILAVLHVSQQQASAPMQELLQGSNLQTRDLQRMQIAFGKAGLNEFKIKDGVVWVPQAKHSSYLAAAAEHDAIPAELKVADDVMKSDTGNPFLSRSQIDDRKHIRRKTQIQEMIIRLPFVEQAWCEMDQAPRQNAFSKTKRSAVLSIRSNPDCQLRVAHVDTIKQMVSKAMTDLPVENIVVIDLNNGFAHLNDFDQLTQKQRELHQIEANQKRFYESRAQEVLRDYPGVEVRVDVAVNEVAVEVEPAVVSTFAPVRQVAAPVAGANGVVSIEIQAPEQPSMPVAHEVETTVQLDKQLRVSVDVPTESVFAALGEPIVKRKHISKKARQASIDQQTRAKFEQFKRTIADRLLPLFPSEAGTGSRLTEHGNSLDFRLIPAVAPVVTAANWQTRAQAWLGTNWPSIGVLGIGAVLLTLVFRRSEHFRPAVDGEVDGSSYGTTGLEGDLSVHNENGIQSDPDSEVQLTKLIQEDPDSAAKIIETWIRDAA